MEFAGLNFKLVRVTEAAILRKYGSLVCHDLSASSKTFFLYVSENKTFFLVLSFCTVAIIL